MSDKNKSIILDVDGNDDIDDMIKSKVGQVGGYGFEAAFGYYNGKKLKLTSIYAESEKDYAKHKNLKS